MRNAKLLLSPNCLERTPKIFAGACFHLDKDEGLAIAANQINLAPMPSTKIAIKNLETVPAKITGGQFFAAQSDPQMAGLRTQKPVAPPAQKTAGGSGTGHVHGVSGGVARCRNPCVG